MELEHIEELVLSYIDKIRPDGIISEKEAKERAADFLYAVAILSTEKRKIIDEKIILDTHQRVLYTTGYNECGAKNVTDKKMEAEVNQDYIRAREGFESAEAAVKYLSKMEDTFNNAHIFYRNLYKDM